MCPEFARRMGWKPFEVDALLRQMDRDGVERSVVQPLDTPDAQPAAITGNLETLRICRQHADRLIPFCCIDPRMMGNTPDADLSQVMAAFRDCGCPGIGELSANLSIRDPRYHNLFRHAGAMAMPVLFHLSGRAGGGYGIIDEPGMTGLEEALRAFPETIFIGHAQAFWAEIDGTLDPAARESYPKGSVVKPGRLCELMARYDNLYADLSATSGYNGVSRDPAFGYAFITTHGRKIFLGTDRCAIAEAKTPPIIGFLADGLESGQLSQETFDNVTYQNFQRVFVGNLDNAL
jgi:predicted TIM-barrel fold metal-dependent hydrolase